MTGNRLRIWLLQTGEPMPLEPGCRLMRTGLVADALTRRGHEVWWISSAFEHQRKRMLFDDDARLTLPNGVILQVLRGSGYRKNVSLARWRDHLQVAAKFRRLAPSLHRPDVVVAALPCHNLAYEAARFCQKNAIPCALDIRDPWPDIFFNFLPGPMRVLAQVPLWRDTVRSRQACHDATALVATSDSFLRWGLGKARRSKRLLDQVFYHGYPAADQAETVAPDWLDRLQGKRLAVFVGTFGDSYELPLLLDAARDCLNRGQDDVTFVLAGEGAHFTAMARQAAALPNVVLPGWIGADEIRALLQRAWVGLAPCRSETGTLPNKIFEYLAYGLPVLSSLTGDVEQLLEKGSCGFSYAPGDRSRLGELLTILHREPEQRKSMAAAARAFFERHGRSDVIYSRYADFVEALASGKEPQS